MKRERLWILGTIALALIIAFAPGAGNVLGLLALPFTALGGFLRKLSLSGGAGNVAAIGIYLAVSAVPLLFWLKGKRKREDWLLVLLSGVTAMVLYYMVNPDLRHSLLQSEVGDIVCTGAFWSCLMTWGVLKLIASGESILKGNIYRPCGSFCCSARDAAF